MAAPRRHLALVCFLHQAWRDTLDQAVDMYGKLLDRNRKLVDERLDDMLKAQRHAGDRISTRAPVAGLRPMRFSRCCTTSPGTTNSPHRNSSCSVNCCNSLKNSPASVHFDAETLGEMREQLALAHSAGISHPLSPLYFPGAPGQPVPVELRPVIASSILSPRCFFQPPATTTRICASRSYPVTVRNRPSVRRKVVSGAVTVPALGHLPRRFYLVFVLQTRQLPEPVRYPVYVLVAILKKRLDLPVSLYTLRLTAFEKTPLLRVIL